MTNRNLAFAGAALLIGGLFAPIVTLPFLGNVNLFNNGTSITALMIVVVAAIAASLAGKERLREVIWPGTAAGVTLIYVFGRLQYTISTIRENISRELVGNPFSGMAQTALSSIQLQWGWLVLGLGAGLLVYVGLMARKEARQATDETAAAETDNVARATVCASLLCLLVVPGWDLLGRQWFSPSGAPANLGTPNLNAQTPPMAMDDARRPTSEEAAYISQHLRIYDLDAHYYDSLLDGRVPGVRFKIQNNGNRTLNRVTVRVVFEDAQGNAIAEQEYNPVLVSQYSYGEDNTPLRPHYIWQQSSDHFMTARNVPSEWQTGRARATITDIDFGPDS